MPKPVRKISRSNHTRFRDDHRFEHWLIDRRVYFITARCRDRYPAFLTEEAKSVFWDRFGHYTEQFGFTPWVTTLLHNHYHTLGFLETGEQLPKLMQRLHGSVAKLVNDLLPDRLVPFFRDARGKEYFDGAIRDQNQLVRAYRYTTLQAQKARLVQDWQTYPHTRVGVSLSDAVRFADENDGYLKGIRYKRYEC